VTDRGKERRTIAEKKMKTVGGLLLVKSNVKKIKHTCCVETCRNTFSDNTWRKGINVCMEKPSSLTSEDERVPTISVSEKN